METHEQLNNLMKAVAPILKDLAPQAMILLATGTPGGNGDMAFAGQITLEGFDWVVARAREQLAVAIANPEQFRMDGL